MSPVIKRGKAMARAVNAQDGYLEALVKNMPSEMVAGYLAVLGLVSGDTAPGAIVWVVWAVFLVATPFYMWLAKPKTDTAERPWWQVWIFAPVAFFAWSMTIGGPWQPIEKSALIGSILIMVLTILVFPLVSMAIARATKK